MPKTLMKRRTTLAVALAASVLPIAAAAPALAAGISHQTSASTSVRSEGAVQRVDDFYHDYSAAVRAGDTKEAKQLRDDNLSSSAQTAATKWESANDADGVLHAQNAPDSIKTTYEQTAAGTAYVQVDLKYGSNTIALTVAYSNVENDISHITDAN